MTRFILSLLLGFFLYSSYDLKSVDKNIAYEDNISEVSKANSLNVHAEVMMTSVQNTYPSTADKVYLTIKNNTSTAMYAGSNYHIEYFNGSWNKVPLNFCATDICFSLPPQGSRDFTIYLFPEQYDYQPGKYRICKTVATDFNINEPERRTYDLTADFIIE